MVTGYPIQLMKKQYTRPVNPVKIAFIVGGFPKLSETFILNQITGLLDLGQEVDIYASRNPGESKVHPDIAKYRLMERVQYFDVPSNRLKRVLKAVGLTTSNFYKNPFRE